MVEVRGKHCSREKEKKNGGGYNSRTQNIQMLTAADCVSSDPAWGRTDGRIALFPGISANEATMGLEDKITCFAKTDSYLKVKNATKGKREQSSTKDTD